jgi:hypothetical protein
MSKRPLEQTPESDSEESKPKKTKLNPVVPEFVSRPQPICRRKVKSNLSRFEDLRALEVKDDNGNTFYLSLWFRYATNSKLMSDPMKRILNTCKKQLASQNRLTPTIENTRIISYSEKSKEHPIGMTIAWDIRIWETSINAIIQSTPNKQEQFRQIACLIREANFQMSKIYFNDNNDANVCDLLRRMLQLACNVDRHIKAIIAGANPQQLKITKQTKRPQKESKDSDDDDVNNDIIMSAAQARPSLFSQTPAFFAQTAPNKWPLIAAAGSSHSAPPRGEEVKAGSLPPPELLAPSTPILMPPAPSSSTGLSPTTKYAFVSSTKTFSRFSVPRNALQCVPAGPIAAPLPIPKPARAISKI